MCDCIFQLDLVNRGRDIVILCFEIDLGKRGEISDDRDLAISRLHSLVIKSHPSETGADSLVYNNWAFSSIISVKTTEVLNE